MKPKKRPFLTIGMAAVDDFDGVYFTVTSLMIHHRDVMDDCEIVVVDNRPGSSQGRSVRDWIRTAVPNGRYVAFAEPCGTAQPRNEVFRRAEGTAVLCIDCHVLLVPGAVRKLIDYYRKNPDCRDLLSGPLLTDSGNVAATHQRPQWSGGAWGVWAVDERGKDPNGEPFEIWQQGMGLFSCRKDAWVGFHTEFRGFGGCESYVMEKFRKRGGRVLCCPWLRWTHRFQRGRGQPYVVDRRDQLRNYLLGFQELGLDPQPAFDHFNASDTKKRAVSPGDASAETRQFAVVGDPAYGGVKMRGRTLSRTLPCKLIAPRQIGGMAERKVIVAIKKGFDPKLLRRKCERLIYDPLDAFCDVRDVVGPADYWRAAFRELRFDEIIATSPACYEVMRSALPDDVLVHMIPHQCDPRIDESWRDPSGPIVYAGLRQFIETRTERIERACRMIGRRFVVGSDCDVLKGASLALALRLPPYDTELNRRCKPQIKLENAAAAGLPVVSTDCPAAISLYPNVKQVRSDFSVRDLADAMRQALDGPGLSDPFDDRRYLAAMRRVLRRDAMVVYTAIFGGYDELHDPLEQLPGVEYVCFTDNPNFKSNVWRVHHCGPTGDPSLQAKRIKILAHEWLNCSISLWIDGRVELQSLNGALDYLKTDMALIRHPRRNCIYAEADHCKSIRRGDPSRIDRAIARYKAEGHPSDYGLWMGGILLRRHTPAVEQFNRAWWREVISGTTRDQLSLPVVLRRLRMSFDTLPKNVPRIRLTGDHRDESAR